MDEKNNIQKIQQRNLRLPAVKGLTFVPNRTISLGINFEFHHPIYFQLPERFLGDKILSYGGALRFEFAIRNNSDVREFDGHVLAKHPLALLVAHDELTIEYFDVSNYV